MIELTKIQNTYKLDILLKKYKNPIQEEDFKNNLEFYDQLKNIQSYIKTRLIIDKMVKKRYQYIKNHHLENEEFFNAILFRQNVLEIFIYVKFCDYYKNNIFNDWYNHEIIIDNLILKYNY